jgi:hypothetical protein
MLDLLTPADIRNWSVFLRAYLVYTSLLLCIYGALCLLGGRLIALLLSVPGGTGDALPLYVSLVMVGLIPNTGIKGFSTVEGKLRRLAHRSVGIPDSLFSRRDIMVGIPLGLEDLGAGLVGQTERRRIAERLRDARAGLGRGEAARVDRLREALVKIIAYRAWIVDHRVWPEESLRGRYARLEEEIEREIGSLDLELDILAAASRLQTQGGDDGKVVAELLATGPGTGLADAETRRRALEERWRGAVSEAETIAKHICALMMLYLERSSTMPQGDEAAESLARYLRRVREDERRAARDFDLIAIAAIVAVLAMAVGGAGANLLRIAEGPTVFMTALNYAVTASLTYGVAMYVAARRRSRRIGRGTWPGAGKGVRARIVPVASAALMGGGAAVLCLVIYNLASNLLAPGAVWEQFAADPGPALRFTAAEELPRLLLSATQAAFLLLALDAAEARDDAGADARWSAALPLLHAASLFCVAALVHEHRAAGGGAAETRLALVYAGGLAATIGALTSLSVLRLCTHAPRDDLAGAGEAAAPA